MARVNKAELAEIFGVSERTFTEWQRDPDFPFVSQGGRGAGNVYDTAEVISWKIERDVMARSREKSKDRLDRVRADEVELRIAEKLGALAPVALFEKAWFDQIVAAKIELQALPLKLAALMQDQYGIEVSIEPITEMVDASLKRLEEGDGGFDDFAESDAESDDDEDGEENS
jgi:terminase small subunit / prophage DNA-packing protein